MVDWNTVQTAFYVALIVSFVFFTAAYLFVRLAVADARQLVSDTLSSEVVQAIAGAASTFTPDKKGGPSSVKGIVVTKGMDILDRLTGGGN